MKKEVIAVVLLLLALVTASIYSRTAIIAINTINRIERVETGIGQLKGGEADNNYRNSSPSILSQVNVQIIEEEIPEEPLKNELPKMNAPHRIREAVSFNGNGDEFVSRWDTTLTSYRSSNSSQIALPLESSGNYIFFVDCGDNTNNKTTSWNDENKNHT